MDSFRRPFARSGNVVGHMESDEKFLRCHKRPVTYLEGHKEKPIALQWDGVAGIAPEAYLIDELRGLTTEENEASRLCWALMMKLVLSETKQTMRFRPKRNNRDQLRRTNSHRRADRKLPA